jgi:hypothetical protein
MRIVSPEAKEEFRLYVMFKPAGSNSIYVPLAVVDWWWKGEATRSGTTWSLVAGSAGHKASPTHVDTSDHPEWTKNIANRQWINE